MHRHQESVDTRNRSRIAMDYARSLRDLTFNSKPIINHLTMLAHENIDMASTIVPIVEDQLSKVHISMKLPTLYLIDSICKNIGQPYIDLFSRNIVSLFLNVYASLPDVNLQNEFIRVLRTWDNVMSLEIIQEIHLGLSKISSRKSVTNTTGGSKHHHPVAMFNGASFPSSIPPGSHHSSSAVMPPPPQQSQQPPPSEMWQISGPSSSSLDSINQNRSTDSSLHSSSSFESINRIHKRGGMPPPPSAYPSQFSPIMIPQSYGIIPSHGGATLPSSFRPPSPSSIQSVPIIPISTILEDLRIACSQPSNRYDPLLVLENSSIDRNLFMEIDSRARIPDKRSLIELLSSILAEGKYSEHSGYSGYSKSVSNLSQSLKSAILLQESSSSKITKKRKTNNIIGSSTAASKAFIPLSSSSSTTAITKTSEMMPSIITNEKMDFNTLDKFVDLTYEDIQKSRPYLHKLIYDFYALQCKNCGFRFPDTEDGKTQMAAHLDAHFRRNMRLKDKSKKILAREWAMKEEDWNQDTQKTIENQASLFVESSAIANLMKKTTTASATIIPTVPAGNEMTELCCPNCKEKLEIKWDDDKEEWVYQNAVKKNNHIYHVDCITIN